MTKLWYKGSPTIESKRSKSLIHPFVVKGYNGLTINPYQGCQHRCAYCYATYEWSPDFYDKIYSKSNAHIVLEKQLSQWRSRTIGPVMVSSATDCYQPAELRFGLTKKCIEVLQKYSVPYYVFTKSALIDRDLELHKRYKENCFIVWSITTANERVRRILEPGTPPASRLFATMKKFVLAGIRCGVNVDPVIPLVTDNEEDIESIVGGCKSADVDQVFGAIMRLRSDIWERMKIVLRLLDIPGALARYKEIYRFDEPISSTYLSANREYSDIVMSILESKISKYGLRSGFPDFLGETILNRAHSGQSTLTGYIT